MLLELIRSSLLAVKHNDKSLIPLCIKIGSLREQLLFIDFPEVKADPLAKFLA